MTRRAPLWLFGGLAVLGLVTILVGGFGNLTVIAATGAVYSILEAKGLAADEALVSDLYAVALNPRPVWTTVQLLGAAVLVLGGIGVWRALRVAR